MANKVLLKKSSVVNKVPLPGDLDYGELALNYADGKLFYKNTSNTVAQIGGGGTAGGILYVFARAQTLSVTVNVGNLAVQGRAGTVNVTI